jgi:hypothetical protein
VSGEGDVERVQAAVRSVIRTGAKGDEDEVEETEHGD